MSDGSWGFSDDLFHESIKVYSIKLGISEVCSVGLCPRTYRPTTRNPATVKFVFISWVEPTLRIVSCICRLTSLAKPTPLVAATELVPSPVWRGKVRMGVVLWV